MSFRIVKGGGSGGGGTYLIHLGDDAKLALSFNKLKELHGSIGLVIAREDDKRLYKGDCVCGGCAACQRHDGIGQCSRAPDHQCYGRCRECFEVVDLPAEGFLRSFHAER